MEKSKVKHIEENGVRWEKSPKTRAEEHKEKVHWPHTVHPI